MRGTEAKEGIKYLPFLNFSHAQLLETGPSIGCSDVVLQLLLAAAATHPLSQPVFLLLFLL